MKKAIVAVPYLSGKGGTETVIKNFHDIVVANDTEIKWKLVSFGGSKDRSWIKNWDKKIYNFSNKRVLQLGAYATMMPFLLKKIIKEERPDYFITTNPIIWHMVSKIKNKYSLSTKIVAWYHYSYKMKKVNPKYLKNVDKFWAISTGIKNELIDLGVKSKKIDIIFNPINFKKAPTVKRSNHHDHFIYIGRIDYDGQKNVSELMKAINFVNEDFKLDLYGTVNEVTKNKLLDLVKDKKKQKDIIFHGFSTNVWEKIKVADGIILTSKYEGLPMVLCEAASRGIPIIAADCPTGVADIVTKDNGILYPMGKVHILKNIINKEISENNLPNQKAVKTSMKKFEEREYFKKIKESLKCVNQ